MNCHIHIKANVDKEIFKSHEEIVVHLVLTFDVTIIYLERNDFFHDYCPQVMLPSGQLASLTNDGALYVSFHTTESGHRGVIRRGYSENYDFPLGKLYDLSVEGQYQICFERDAVKGLQSYDPRDSYPVPEYIGPAYSNTVSFIVAK